ncbi:hypothetical protein [Desulfosporosinus sp. SB140]|uniref:hypothetical protein n=1 Tax=Desulfosporosinus paludis TaxID=3115649 RepID=UPI00388FE893
MVKEDDWRLQGQENYLLGIKLRFEKYSPYSKTWDHDHCEFCWSKFMLSDDTDVQTEGYTTEDHYRWICKKCFEDFKEMYKWQLD